MRDVWVKWYCKRLKRIIITSPSASPDLNEFWMCDCIDNNKHVWTKGDDEYHNGLLRGFRY